MLLKPVVSATNTEAFQYGDLLASKDIMSKYVQIITHRFLLTQLTGYLRQKPLIANNY